MNRLDITPIAKGRPLFGKGGHAYTPQKTRDYEREIFTLLISQGNNPVIVPVQLFVEFYLPRPKRLMRKKDPPDAVPHTGKPDVSNLLKAFEDGAEGALWEDDKQIWNVQASKYYHAKDDMPHIMWDMWRG